MKHTYKMAFFVLILCLTILSGCSNNTTLTQQSAAGIDGKKVKALSAGTSYSFALTDQGEVYAWGDNSFGQLGTGNKTGSLLPVKVNIPEPVAQIAAGPRGMALTESGRLYTWGTNQYGEIGDGSNDDRLLPVRIEIPGKVTKIFRSSESMVLTQNGSLYMWGWNMHGEVGNGTTEHVKTPYKIELPRKVIEAASFGTHTLALCDDGSLYAWGSNYFGELGDGQPIVNSAAESGDLMENNVTKPVKVAVKLSVKAIAAGNGASYALCSDGNVYAWGANDVGQLGIGKDDVKYTSVPMRVQIKEQIRSITAGQFHALAETADGAVYCWGYNQKETGVLGLNNKSDKISLPQRLPVDENIAEIYAGGGHTYILCRSGKVYGWGANAFGQLGTGNIDKQTEPLEIKLHS